MQTRARPSPAPPVVPAGAPDDDKRPAARGPGDDRRPLVLFIVECWAARTRYRRPTLVAIRDVGRGAWPLLVSLVPYVGWVLVLRVGLGAWPTGSIDGRLALVPFSGAVAVWHGWGFDETALLLLLVVPAVAALVLSRNRPLRLVVVAHLLAAATFGEAVWLSAHGFARVLLPLSLVSVLALAAPASAEGGTPEGLHPGERRSECRPERRSRVTAPAR